MIIKYTGEINLTKFTEGAACFDFTVLEDDIITPHRTKLIGTGITMEIPKGYHGLIYLRSSAGIKTPLRLANGTGIIDSDYRGEIMLALENTSDYDFRLYKGERYCQFMVQPDVPFKLHKVTDSKLSKTQRGKGGFGSTSNVIVPQKGKTKSKIKKNTKEND
jgi:dUTP pyrophosphatase